MRSADCGPQGAALGIIMLRDAWRLIGHAVGFAHIRHPENEEVREAFLQGVLYGIAAEGMRRDGADEDEDEVAFAYVLLSDAVDGVLEHGQDLEAYMKEVLEEAPDAS